MLATAPEGFFAPDFTLPLDVEAFIAQTPSDATLRGMFFNSYLDEAKRRGIVLEGTHSYLGFKFYPLRSWLAFIVDVARKFHPQLPIRAALREVGLSAYPTFAASIVGRVIFGVLGKDLARIMRVASKGFEHSLNSAKVELVAADERSVRLHLQGVYGFLESYNVGVFEGAIKVCEREGDVLCRPIAFGEAEVFCRWT